MRRRMMMNTKLPYDAEIGWLGIRQNTWIVANNGFIPTGNNVVVEAKIEFIGYPTTSNYAKWFEARTGADYKSFRVIKGVSESMTNVNNNTNDNYTMRTNFVPQANTIYDITLSFGAVVINNTTYTLYTNTNGYENTSPFLIGDNSAQRGINENVYYFKAYKGGVLMLDLIPVRKGNVGYLYDKVSKQIFGNAGTGDFILGQDK